MKLVTSFIAFAVVCAAFLASSSYASVALKGKSAELWTHEDRVRQLIGNNRKCFDLVQLPSGRLVVLDPDSYCLGAISRVLNGLKDRRLPAPELVQSDALREKESVYLSVHQQPEEHQGLLAVLPILSAPWQLTFFGTQITSRFADQLSAVLDAHDQQLQAVGFVFSVWDANSLHLLKSLARQQRLKEISVLFLARDYDDDNSVAFLQRLRDVLVRRESAWPVQRLDFAHLKVRHQQVMTELLAQINEQRMPHLRHLSITDANWSDGLLQQVVLLLPHLQILDVSDGGLDHEQLWEIVRAVPNAQDSARQFSVLDISANPGSKQLDETFMEELVALSARIDAVFVRQYSGSQIPAIAQARHARWLAACPNGELDADALPSNGRSAGRIVLTPRTPACMNMFGRLYDNHVNSAYVLVSLSAAERERTETWTMLEANTGLTEDGRDFLRRLLTGRGFL